MTKLVFGCGYLGLRVARRWRERGEEVFAVTRSTERAAELAQLGLGTIVADVTKPDTLKNLPPANTVLYAVGYDRTSGASISEVYVEGLRHVLAVLPPPERFIYISSTGVYGQSSGEWVDESSPCQPLREGGRACLAAERLLQQHPVGAKAIVLRMGGLYGPGRIPRRRDLEAGQPIAAAEHGFLNLIHADDAANVVLAAEARAPLPSLYAVADHEPVLRGDYFRELTRLAGLPEPRFEPPAQPNPRTERAATDKRIRNDKMNAELQVELNYPTYREGLAAVLALE